MKHDEFEKLIEKYLELTTWGFGVNMEYSEGLSRPEYLTREHEKLKEQLRNFELCVEWLGDYPICEGWNAHYWKDQVQSHYKPDHPGYFHIARGVFILAALHQGYEAEKMAGSTDAWVRGGEHYEHS